MALHTRARPRTAVQIAALTVGAVFRLIGAAGHTTARTAGRARAPLVGGGTAYLVHGLVADHDSADFVPLHDADRRRFLPGIATLLVGTLLSRRRVRRG
ncbi:MULTISPECIES: hypothetical protein [Streptomyces]|uniref:hypothetical protein n=1 Tax=Streptomyces TaxID=1883 RepID=UPI002F949072